MTTLRSETDATRTWPGSGRRPCHHLGLLPRRRRVRAHRRGRFPGPRARAAAPGPGSDSRFSGGDCYPGAALIRAPGHGPIGGSVHHHRFW